MVGFEFSLGAFGYVRFAFRVLRYEHVVNLGFAFVFFSGDKIGVAFLGVGLGTLRLSGSMRLRTRFWEMVLCVGSGVRVNLPVVFGMLGGKVVFASNPITVVSVSLELPMDWRTSGRVLSG